jgi:hypothetical protein
MVLDPISIYFNEWRYEGFFNEVGRNPFQFWLLMNSVGWGHTVYQTIFLAFSVVSTGLVYYDEKNSAVYDMLITRKNKGRYYLSKASSTFLVTFANFIVLLSINVLVTYLIFPIDAPHTEYYDYLIPKEGMFSYVVYQQNPLSMVLLYVVMNAFVIALNALIVLGIHEIVPLKNRYLALLVPFIVLFLIKYLVGILQAGCPNMNLNVIIQPQAASALVTMIKSKDVWQAFEILILFTLLLQGIGYIKNRESL